MQLTFDTLKKYAGEGTIDTVLVTIIDMQGRLVGKRFHAEAFIEGGYISRGFERA